MTAYYFIAFVMVDCMGWRAQFRESIMRDPLLSRAYVDEADTRYYCARWTSWTYMFVPDALHIAIADLRWNLTDEPHFFTIVDVDYDDEEECYYLYLYVGRRIDRVSHHGNRSQPW